MQRLTQLYNGGRLPEALQLVGATLELFPAPEPALADLLNIAGAIAQQSGNLSLAERYWRQAIVANAHHSQALFNLGFLLTRLRRPTDEAAIYRRALSAMPNSPQAQLAYNNLGNALQALEQWDKAEAAFRKATQLAPQQVASWINLGNLLRKRGDYVEAAEAFARAHAAQPDDGHTLAEWLQCRRAVCDWEGIATLEARLVGLLENPVCRVPPFQLLALESVSPALHLSVSRRFAESLYAEELAVAPMVRGSVEPRGRLRMAYLSGDFHAHATVWLLAGVLEQHDRERFDIFLYSYGPASDTAERRRLLNSGHTFRELQAATDAEIAQSIADDGIDILVDLKGYTQAARPGIVARRPAPLIVNWLGYPGSMGHARLADYVIGDATVSPPEHAAHFSETLALLPGSYQPNDQQRVMAEAPTRAEVGLPEQSVVFCNFNQTYKITPGIFALWCRLLAVVPGSVLWQLQPPQAAGLDYLRRAAEQNGIAAERLVFAPPLPQAQHLGRLSLADIALDTWPCASHTTASDALWAGVPLVARLGEHFVSRVSASVVRAAGLPELVAASDDEYFALALKLAEHPDQRAALRARLVEARSTAPLFDTARFTRELESLYVRIWEQECRGERRMVLPSATDAERA